MWSSISPFLGKHPQRVMCSANISWPQQEALLGLIQQSMTTQLLPALPNVLVKPRPLSPTRQKS